jgi:hypothetical protein
MPLSGLRPCHTFEPKPRREIKTECGEGGIAWNS